nr:synaptic vesicle glycoprotein 2B-like isoform X2 [Leptinotarsa decemlineata]
MCEESTCLVPPLDTPQNRSTNNRPSFSPIVDVGAESQNRGALVSFHEDALSQTTVGKAQFILACVLGLGLAADCSELTILGFILPAAELQLCIGEEKKKWLGSITLLAMAGGSLAWGILGDHLGRRRALISALSVTALFSTVASVMPTYGTFMTARFCSGLGVSGAFPLSFSYLMEMCHSKIRLRYVGLLHAFWPLGAAFIVSISYITMPTQGADIVQDNREHWSAWHKLLILSTLPTVCCILGLIWAPESPRYLLEASREVEALAVYQRLHGLNSSKKKYGLTELELPARSAYRDRQVSPTKSIINNGVASFREAFQFVSCPTHFRRTLLLASLNFLIGFMYTGSSEFIPFSIKVLREQEYFSQKQYINDRTFADTIFNGTMENMRYSNTLFRNVSFRHMSLNHVEFINCTVEESEFINIKTSVSYFKDSVVKDSRFIDTDLTAHLFMNCSLVNSTFLSVISDCTLSFDYNIYLEDLHVETLKWSLLMAIFLVFQGFISSRRFVIMTVMLLIGVSSLMLLLYHQDIEGLESGLEVTKVFLMCILSAVTVVVVEGYPCHLRCTAVGTMRSLFHIGSLCAIPIYGMLVREMLLFPVVLTTALSLYCTLLLRNVIQDDVTVLL